LGKHLNFYTKPYHDAAWLRFARRLPMMVSSRTGGCACERSSLEIEV
jgi:hypothetical protein